MRLSFQFLRYIYEGFLLWVFTLTVTYLHMPYLVVRSSQLEAFTRGLLAARVGLYI